MGSIDPIFPADLVAVDLYDLFRLGSDIFKPRVELVKGKFICSKQPGDHFIKGFGL